MRCGKCPGWGGDEKASYPALTVPETSFVHMHDNIKSLPSFEVPTTVKDCFETGVQRHPINPSHSYHPIPSLPHIDRAILLRTKDRQKLPPIRSHQIVHPFPAIDPLHAQQSPGVIDLSPSCPSMKNSRPPSQASARCHTIQPRRPRSPKKRP